MNHRTLVLLAVGLLLTPVTRAQATFSLQQGIGLHGARRPATRSSRSASWQKPQVPGSHTVVDFGTIDFPGTSDSAAYNINDHGQIAGGYGPDLEGDSSDSGFILSHNDFKVVNFPGAVQTTAGTINNSGEIMGIYLDPTNTYHGFQIIKGTYTSIDFPGAIQTVANGLSNSGEIVGSYDDTGSPGHGYMLIGGTYTTIDYPGAAQTFPAGVNVSGEIVGAYIDTSGTYHGFIWVSGVFTTLDYPGAPDTFINSINDSGVLVGAYGDGNSFYAGFEHGFAYQSGQFLEIDVPFVGVGATQAVGLNKFGQIAGYYVDTAGRFYGFTAKITP
jgi:uncharacterized membrane protein